MFFQIFGKINPPDSISQGYGDLYGVGGHGGLVGFLSNILKFASLAAGLFAIVNFVLAGYGIMTSNGEPEKMTKATQKIWNSILGLVLIVASFAFAVLLGWILFHKPDAILKLEIYGPEDVNEFHNL